MASCLAAAVLACAERGRRTTAADAAGGTRHEHAGQRYVRLVLAVGQHDPDYVDAYYGPPEWRHGGRQAAAGRHRPRRRRRWQAGWRRRRRPAERRPLEALRHRYLTRQLEALRARVAMLGGHEADVRRGVEGALRRRGAAPRRARSSSACWRSSNGCCPGRARCSTATTRFRDAYVIPRDGSTPRSRRPSTAAAAQTLAHVSCRRRELHRRVRHRQELERLQLVSGQLSQPDPGQHRSADLRRPRHRPRVPRGLSGPPRLQRAAREAPGARARLDGVLRLPAVLAAVAHRRGHRQLRHRGRVSRRPSGWSSSAT